MKGVLVANSLQDIVYFWADAELKAHWNTTFLKDEAISQDDNASIDLDAVLQFFSPFLLSVRMQRRNCGYKSITLGNGMILVVGQRDDHVFLVMNGDGQESEEFLRQKLRIFQCLVHFHFGINVELLKPANSESRKNLWESLSNILQTYSFLCSQQYGFLVEANEMIQVNQHLNEMSIHLLEAVVNKANKEGDPLAKHAVLLVNSKVLAFFSQNNSCKLYPPDIMLLTTLVCTKFPLPLQSIPLSVNRTPPPLAHDTIRFDHVHIRPKDCPFEEPEDDNIQFGEMRSTNVDIKSGIKTAYSREAFSVFPTLSEECISTIGGDEIAGNDDQLSKDHSSDSDRYFTPEEDKDDSYKPEVAKNPSSVQPKSRLWEETSNSSNSFTDPDNELFRRRIFLSPAPNVYIPHTVHCLQISPGTVLLIISEVRRGEIAKDLCNMTTIMSGLIDDSAEIKETMNLMEKMEQHMRRIFEGMKGKAHVKEKNLEKYVNSVRHKWEKLKSSELLAHHLQNKQKLSAILEGILSEMLKGLQTLFGAIYCSGDAVKGPSISIHHAKALYRIQEMVQKKLQDYKGFLTAKGERNVTITRYLEEFPGLVHFIYIDRTANRVIAPSINTDPSQIFNPRDPAHFIKQSIWDGWNYIKTFLVQGHTSVALRYGDFLLSYVLWFEDSSGNQRAVKDTSAFATDFPEAPGIIGSNFYSELKRRCFPAMTREKIGCHELFCMHLGVLPLSHATSHARRLASMMGDVSSGAMVVALLT